jgi:hypothetical protein
MVGAGIGFRVRLLILGDEVDSLAALGKELIGPSLLGFEVDGKLVPKPGGALPEG